MPTPVDSNFRAMYTTSRRLWTISSFRASAVSLSRPPGLRVAPYHTIAGAGMLAAFRPQSLRVQVEGRWLEVEGYLALMPVPAPTPGGHGVAFPHPPAPVEHPLKEADKEVSRRHRADEHRRGRR